MYTRKNELLYLTVMKNCAADTKRREDYNMRTAVVTGASSGMGREFVRQLEHFYKNLDEIWVIARREDRLNALKAELRTPVRIFTCDLIKKKSLKEYRNSLEELKPDVKMLVNAAGFGKSGTFADIYNRDEKDQPDMVELNCTALTRMIQITLPYLSKGGRIINLASAAAFCPQPEFAVYAATKAYVLSLSRSLGAELSPRGIVVTAVCPGPVETEFFQVCGNGNNPFKKLVMADARKVVRQALLDSRKKKTVSVYGTPMKASRLAAKLLPQNLILKAEELMIK